MGLRQSYPVIRVRSLVFLTVTVVAHAREQEAWNRLSAFVLCDIKNAGTMLSLLQGKRSGIHP